jgi:hypothetical protein
MKASELKVGSQLEINQPTPNNFENKVVVKITRCSSDYVWFKGSSYSRIGRTTIDKFPTLYKIISI